MIKSFNAEKGFGFIECREMHDKHGRDVFLHRKQMGDFRTGTQITFTCQVNKDGMPQANDIEDLDGRKPGPAPPQGTDMGEPIKTDKGGKDKGGKGGGKSKGGDKGKGGGKKGDDKGGKGKKDGGKKGGDKGGKGGKDKGGKGKGGDKGKKGKPMVVTPPNREGAAPLPWQT